MSTPRVARIPQSTIDLLLLVREEMALHGPSVDLNHINLSQLNGLSEVFMDTNFTGDISKWNVSRVESMDRLFQNCPFNGDISDWDTSALRTSSQMFNKSGFNGDISRWNTSNLIAASAMFRDSQFNRDISQWDTSQLSAMVSMFQRSAFNGDISNWSVTRALGMGRMENMFEGTPYTGDLSGWRITDVRHMHNAFSPQFRGMLPCSADPIKKVFYANLFGTSQRLHRYLRTQEFGGCHFDILRLAPNQPEWAKKEDYQWAKQLAKTAQSIGMDDDALRSYAMGQYRNRQAGLTQTPLTLDIGEMALG